ncbi:MAG: DUF1735 domain-containing protein, partial [Pedobacter sp.]
RQRPAEPLAQRDPEKAGGNIIEFMNPSEIAVHGSTTALYVLSYPIVPTETIVPISVAYVGAENGAPQDITVNIGLDNQALIDQYNTENSKSYEFMPAAWYSIKSTSVVIPKGAKSASFNVGIRTSLFDLTKTFAVPVKITSASHGIISTNFSRVLLAFGAKNPYDGLYRYQTSAITSLVPNADKTNVPLVTTGPNTVEPRPGLLATYSNQVVYTIDPTTNAVTVTCPSLGVATPQDTRSKWDPATKTLKVFWKQGNGGRTFEETYTYTGVR